MQGRTRAAMEGKREIGLSTDLICEGEAPKL